MICKCGRYMEGKRYDLILGGLTEGNLVTTNCKKSAEGRSSVEVSVMENGAKDPNKSIKLLN